MFDCGSERASWHIDAGSPSCHNLQWRLQAASCAQAIERDRKRDLPNRLLVMKWTNGDSWACLDADLKTKQFRVIFSDPHDGEPKARPGALWPASHWCTARSARLRAVLGTLAPRSPCHRNAQCTSVWQWRRAHTTIVALCLLPPGDEPRTTVLARLIPHASAASCALAQRGVVDTPWRMEGRTAGWVDSDRLCAGGCRCGTCRPPTLSSRSRAACRWAPFGSSADSQLHGGRASRRRRACLICEARAPFAGGASKRRSAASRALLAVLERSARAACARGDRRQGTRHAGLVLLWSN